MRFCPLCDADVEGAICAVHSVPTVSPAFFEVQRQTIVRGATLGGRFRMEESLGEGNSGVVFRANQLGVNRSVAVKMLKKQRLSSRTALRRFFLEAQTLLRLQHPNIVQLIEFGIEESTQTPFLVTEHVRGDALSKLLDMQGAFPEKIAAAMMQKILSALATAHGLGFVHRDLKPANILVTKFADGELHPKVLDFGLVKMMDDGGLAFTAPGAVVGTPMYMSPEQAKGRSINASSDVYSAGAIFHQLLSGRLPFNGTTLPELLIDKMKGAPLLPANVASAPIVELIARMLAPAEEERISLEDASRALIAFLSPAMLETVDTVVSSGERTGVTAVTAVSSMGMTGTGMTGTGMTPMTSVTELSGAPRASLRWLIAPIAVLAGVALAGALGFGAYRFAAPSAEPVRAPARVVPVEAVPAAKSVEVAAVPRAAEKPVEKQIVRVTTNPSGAEVSIDGALRGATPLELEVPPEGCTMQLSKNGYFPVTVRLGSATPKVFAVELAAKPVAAVKTKPHVAPPAPPKITPKITTW